MRKFLAVCTALVTSTVLVVGGATMASADDTVTPEATVAAETTTVEAPATETTEAPAEVVAETPVAEPVAAEAPTPVADTITASADTTTAKANAPPAVSTTQDFRFNLTVWVTATYGVQFPDQNLVGHLLTNSPKLDQLDDLLVPGFCYQVDLYKNSAITDELIKIGHLVNANNPREDWVGGSYKSEFSKYLCIPATAKFDFGFTLGTCTTPGTLVYDKAVNATVDATSTPSGTAGPGTYTISVTANANAKWADQKTATKVFTGLIPGPDTTLCPTNQCVAGVGTLSTNVNDLWQTVDTRSAGHVEYVSGGLHVYTDNATSEAKVSEALPVNFALKNTGTLNLAWTGSTAKPGINLYVNFGADGNGTLVQEDVYGQDLWLTNGSSATVKANAPVIGGGNGSQWHGTIDQWLTKYPDATVSGLAYSLGSGVKGDGVITGITANCATHTFNFVPPTEATPALGTITDLCGAADDSFTAPENTDLITYTALLSDSGLLELNATPVGYTVLTDLPEGYVLNKDGTATYTYQFNTEACPVVEEPPVTPVVPATPTQPGTLASTGSEAALPGLLALTVIFGGIALALTARKRRLAQTAE